MGSGATWIICLNLMSHSLSSYLHKRKIAALYRQGDTIRAFKEYTWPIIIITAYTLLNKF